MFDHAKPTIQPMKAITLWQPWASLLAHGAKKYETRSWATKYRGPIAIHAAATPFKRIIKNVFPLHEWNYAPDYTAKREFVDFVSKYIDIDSLCYGAVLATAELVGCYQIAADTFCHTRILVSENDIEPFGHDEISKSDDEFIFGDWTQGRYAWEFSNMTLLSEPIPAKGWQGLWNWNGDLI